MIAALPMYDRPETAAAHDALWHLVREAHGGALPARLCRDIAPAEGWSRSDLVLGQICGLPLRTTFRGRVAYVGTGTYDIDAPPGHYRSVWLVRSGDRRSTLRDFNGADLAISGFDSHSGWAAPLSAAAREGVRFAALRETGAHAASADAVAAGRADVTAVDEVSWRAIRRHDVCARRLRVLGATPPSPGLAFITARGRDTDRMFRALAAAIAGLPAEHRATLGLQGVVVLPLEAYHAVETPSVP